MLCLQFCSQLTHYTFFGSFGLSTKRALYNHEFSVVHRHPTLASAVHTSPWHMVRHRNFIFGIHKHICPPYIHIKYLMILTCSFKWQPFWYFSLICYPVHTGNHRDFISHILKYLFFTYFHKRNNAIVTYFLKFVSIFKKIHIPSTSLRHHVL